MRSLFPSLPSGFDSFDGTPVAVEFVSVPEGAKGIVFLLYVNFANAGAAWVTLVGSIFKVRPLLLAK